MVFLRVWVRGLNGSAPGDVCGGGGSGRLVGVVGAALALGINARGPFPADTIFAAKRVEFDGIVTVYHDQGQIAMKIFGFDRGVTVQGGLPITIATPAHGTAFDIVGRGIANPGATGHAFDLAVSITARKIAALSGQARALRHVPVT